MSRKELDRASIIQSVIDKRLRQHEAARQLGLSERPVRRLVRCYRETGAIGLVSVRREKPPHNTKDPSMRKAVLAQVRERYADFGPNPGGREAGTVARSSP